MKLGKKCLCFFTRYRPDRWLRHTCSRCSYSGTSLPLTVERRRWLYQKLFMLMHLQVVLIVDALKTGWIVMTRQRFMGYHSSVSCLLLHRLRHLSVSSHHQHQFKNDYTAKLNRTWVTWQRQQSHLAQFCSCSSKMPSILHLPSQELAPCGTCRMFEPCVLSAGVDRRPCRRSHAVFVWTELTNRGESGFCTCVRQMWCWDLRRVWSKDRCETMWDTVWNGDRNRISFAKHWNSTFNLFHLCTILSNDENDWWNLLENSII